MNNEVKLMGLCCLFSFFDISFGRGAPLFWRGKLSQKKRIQNDGR